MRLIDEVNKIAIDMKKNEGPAGGNKKDNINEPAAVNTVAGSSLIAQYFLVGSGRHV